MSDTTKRKFRAFKESHLNVTDLNISVDLTTEGVKKWPKIVEIIFQFIYLIHQLSEDELKQQFRKYSVSINNGNFFFTALGFPGLATPSGPLKVISYFL